MSISSGSPLPGAATGTATVLPAAAVEGLPRERLHDHPDVTTRVLWRDGGSLGGVVDVPAGARLAAHIHDHAHHHAWVLSGSARMLGVTVGPGSYVHVPAGTEHAVEDVSEDGVVMLYLYLYAG